MPLVSSSIPNLVSGVSQQPAPSRLRTAGEVIENASLSVVQGLSKRPPSHFIAKLGSLSSEDSSVSTHVIDRSKDEKYILTVASDQTLEMYDQFGVQQSIDVPEGTAYLPSDPTDATMRFVTVADTTFCLNPSVQVQAKPVTVETRPNPALQASIFIKRSVANVAYAIYVDGVLGASFNTSANVSASTSLEGTSAIASNLRDSAIANGYSGVTVEGTTVIWPITEGQVVQVTDEFGGDAMEVYTSRVQAFEDLPPREVIGRLVQIQGDIEENDTSYWVEYTADGIWQETVGWGEEGGIDPATMPHVLVKKPSGGFEFKSVDWPDRLVGDSETNPNPSFVGGTINNLFLFKGRLGLLSSENVIMSEVGVLENFYATTVVQNFPSDPIDLAAATGRVSTLYHAAAFSDELLLFSDKQQLRLTSGTVLSGETAGITTSTTFPCSTEVSPVTVGSSVFFVNDGKLHATAREVVIDTDREVIDGEFISVQIPRYIPANPRMLASSPTAQALVVLPSGGSNQLYIYRWYEDVRRKVQSAWSRWSFDPSVRILSIGFLNDYLHVIYRVGLSLRMDRIDVDNELRDDPQLDHQIDHTQFTSMSYDVVSGLTTVVLPFDTPEVLEMYRTTGGILSPFSETSTVTKVSDDTYTISGDVTAEEMIVGRNYEFIFEFSTQYLREENSDGESSIQDGRLQLRNLSVIYTDTSYFEAHVSVKNGGTRKYSFSGRVLSDPGNTLNTIAKSTGEFRFPIMSHNEDVTIRLYSNQPYACSFGSAEWTAMYKPKARRMRS